MFRFALAAFAFLANTVAVSAVTCQFPQVVEENGVTVFGSGMNWQETTTITDPTLTEMWYELTVANICRVTLAMNTCTSNSPPVTIYVYKKAGLDCNNPGATTPLGQATENCGALFPGDEGAAVSFTHNQVGQTTYLIRVQSSNGGPFDFPGVMDLDIQGSVMGHVCGDPHFRRWHQAVRDSFHGECDMVLFHKDQVEEGKDLDVHIRTTIRDSYSFVETVAMKYGNDVLEFQHDALFINGEKQEEENALVLGSSTVKMVDESKRMFSVNINNKAYVEVHSTKQFMGVSVHGDNEVLMGSHGILGEFETGDMIGRDGKAISNFEEFGFEWQVHPSDPQLFLDAREPQLPYERCRMPSVSAESRRRKLRGQDRKLYEKALEACMETHIPENMQSCVDDVMFTGEIDLAYVV